MKLHTLKPNAGSVKTAKRLGRGPGSGLGGTSARGHKGAKSRSGYKSKIGFEGGQMPLYRRIPKFGFKSPFKVTYKQINVGTLDSLSVKLGTTDITLDVLKSNGLVSSSDRVKILNSGSLTKGLKVEAHAFSETAKSTIEGLGGKAILL